MKVSGLIEELRKSLKYTDSDVYVQSGYNRFKIKDLAIDDSESIVIVIEDDADNPKPTNQPIRNA